MPRPPLLCRKTRHKIATAPTGFQTFPLWACGAFASSGDQSRGGKGYRVEPMSTDRFSMLLTWARRAYPTDRWQVGYVLGFLNGQGVCNTWEAEYIRNILFARARGVSA